MEHKQFESIQGWFEILNTKIEKGEETVGNRVENLSQKVDHIEETMATKQQLENRFQMIYTSMSVLSKKIESYHDQQNEEISILRHALRDLEREVKELHQAAHS